MDIRKRYMFRFWLNVNKPDQLALGEHLEALRLKRKLAPTIRNALTLFFDLKNRKMDSLLHLFPWIDDYFRNLYAQQIPDDIAAQLQRQTELLELLVNKQKAKSKNGVRG